MKLRSLIILSLATSMLGFSCANQPIDVASNSSSSSELTFIPFSSAGRCTISKARQSVVNICINGGGSQEKAKAQSWAKRAMLTWFRALKMIDDKVTSNIGFDCSRPDLTINLRPGSGTSFASCGKTTIYMQRPYGTYLHEFGHAVAALSDTYTGRQAGQCRSGQPQSLMCWGAYGKKDSEGFNVLYPDDVAGVQSIYRKIFKDLTPPSFTIDPYALLNPENPWPNGGTATNPVAGLFAKIGQESNSGADTYKLFVSTPLTDSAVFACEGNQSNSCTAGAATRINAKQVATTSDRRIFELSSTVAVREGVVVSIFSAKPSGTSSAWSSELKIKFTAAGLTLLELAH